MTFLDDDDDFVPTRGQAATQSARGGRRSAAGPEAYISPRSILNYLDDDSADYMPMPGQAGRQSVQR